MSWRVSWFDEEETIVLVKLSGNWSWSDLEAASAQAYALRTSKNVIVHLICDLTDGAQTPDDQVLVRVMKVYAHCHDHGGLKVMVGATSYIQVAISVITKVMGGSSTFRYVDTLDEAAALLQRFPVQQPM
jgi:hypothetical protein